MKKLSEIRLAIWDEENSRYLKTYKNHEGKRQAYLEHIYHGSMMTRATSENYKRKFPSYVEVRVVGDIINYNYFVDWSRKQIGFGKEGWVLDKDILVPNNKIYSKETCVFVPKVINAFFSFTITKTNELPVGVSWCKSEGKFKAYCSQLDGKNKTLGRFDNPDDAAEAYREFKNSLAKKLMIRFGEDVDPRVCKALSDFDVANY